MFELKLVKESKSFNLSRFNMIHQSSLTQTQYQAFEIEIQHKCIIKSIWFEQVVLTLN